MIRASFSSAAAIAAATTALFALLNQPEMQPGRPDRRPHPGLLLFSPLRAGEGAAERIYPSVGEIEADRALPQGKAHALRTYTMDGTQMDAGGARGGARHRNWG